MTDPVNSFRVSLTYQGNQPQVNPADLANLGIDPIAASTPADKVLDLSDSKLLATELSQQDLNNVKSIKVGSTYLSIPDAAVLKTLVEQLKSVCLDTKGKLRTDFQYIDFASRVNPAAKAEAVTTSLVLNVVGPEPNDGYVNTSQRDLIGGVHLIQPGDNLVNIARLLYGGSEGDVLANAQRLANFNHFADPNKIPAGKTLYLIDADFLKTISSKPPAVSTEPSVIDEVVGGEAGGQAGGTSVEDLHGAEHFTEQPATVNGLLRFIGKDVFGLITNYEHSVPKMYWDG
ncbi:MAG TPA: LysM domain-containing protein, partial [Candidatus Obscuribacterales bacterium]